MIMSTSKEDNVEELNEITHEKDFFYISLKYYIILDISIHTLGKNKEKYFINSVANC